MKTTAHQFFEEAKIAEAHGDKAECLEKITRCLLLDPSNDQAWDTRATTLLRLGAPFDSVLCSDKAIALKPNQAEYYLNRGGAYSDAGEYEKSFENYDKALELKPVFSIAHMNKANIYRVEKQLDKAIASYREAVKADENNVDAHLGLSFSLLEDGQYTEGWQEYEWRWKSSQLPPRGMKVPQWDGTPAEFETDVLVFYAEQGFGDVLQFIRYAPLVKEKWGGKVFVEVRMPMLRLAKTIKGVDGVIAFGEMLPINMKKCLPMMSAPKIMGTTVETIPNGVPYLHPSPSAVGMWRERLKALPPGLKVGVCWAGGQRPFAPIANAIDKKRSTTLSEFGPLCLPGISFVSLQVGPLSSQVQSGPVGMTIGDWTSEIDDFYDTAALISCLDLVIAVDTSVVHIAGALGKPVWMLSRFDNCWRWLGYREDSPWYPTLKQFVQPAQGDWFGLMQNVKRNLQVYLAQRKAA